ncbi:MAG: hypothetical protein M1823_003255 [Watsoniomyces obsoletus]|nr:MAG: hypothetical protein M1823_003255 [Watsoniomyces obsoletus]
MTEVTPPPLQGPTSKEKKYDRQLRLWAANGQAALEEAHVLLVNSGCGVVGIETLKNLVLPGIGSFTIVDTHHVTEADLGINFFLDEDSLGQSRAEHCCRLLQELNPDVNGHFITESIETCMNNPDFFKSYTLVIFTFPIPQSTLQDISRVCEEHHIPLFFVQSIGFYSHFSIALPSAFPIVETHPDPVSAVDLRLLDPWPELVSLVKETTNNLDSIPDYEHGHIPYVLLLLHYLESWKQSHMGKPPQSYKEKLEFRELVRSGARIKNAGGEENFEEAVGAVLKSLNPFSLSSGLKEVFEADECQHLTEESANFWIIASAIADFYEIHGCLPLPGSLPDMKAQSADYIRLQNVYRTKAKQDLVEIVGDVREKERELGRDDKSLIDEKEIEAFCKNAAWVKLIRGKPLQVVRYGNGGSWGDRASFAGEELLNPDSLLPLYVVFLAYTSLFNDDDDPETGTPSKAITKEDNDEGEMQQQEILATRTGTILDELWKENGREYNVEVEGWTNQREELEDRILDIVKEMVRAGTSEMHNTSSFTGGMLAQEIIKVITKQFIPVNSTCVWDGIRSRVGVYRL